ncbi:MAG: hypothetical protein AB1521_07665 [Bacteroidota bacterium]
MKKTLLLVSIITILFLVGCNKEDSPTEANNSGGSSNQSGQPMPNFDNSDNNGVLATINYETNNPMPNLPPINMNLAFASLGSGVDAGTVSVNNNSLGKLTASGKTYYIIPNPSNPFQQLDISFNSSSHSWNVAGGNGIPALSGTVVSPNNFSMTAPANNSSIAKANGMQLTWSGGTSSKIFVQVISKNDPNKTKYYQELSDNGSYTFSATDLSGISGECLVYVVKYNYNISNNDGKKYYIISEVVKNAAVTLN